MRKLAFSFLAFLAFAVSAKAQVTFSPPTGTVFPYSLGVPFSQTVTINGASGFAYGYNLPVGIKASVVGNTITFAGTPTADTVMPAVVYVKAVINGVPVIYFAIYGAQKQ